MEVTKLFLLPGKTPVTVDSVHYDHAISRLFFVQRANMSKDFSVGYKDVASIICS